VMRAARGAEADRWSSRIGEEMARKTGAISPMIECWTPTMMKLERSKRSRPESVATARKAIDRAKDHDRQGSQPPPSVLTRRTLRA
jgi:hypothetical protein